MRTLAQRQLRNESGEILRQAEAGQTFAVTVGGRPVALLSPYPKRRWVSRGELLGALAALPSDPTLLEELRELGDGVDALTDPWQR